MKPLFILILVCSTMFKNVAGQNYSSQDSLQVLAIIGDWNKAWQTKDYVLASKGYSKDAVFTNAFGDKCNGQPEVEALLKKVFGLDFVMAGNSETSAHGFQILNTTTVIVHTAVIRKGQKMPDGSLVPERQTTHMRVFEKANGKWQIKAHLISDARDKQIPKH